MSKQHQHDFERGYCYACQRYKSWIVRTNPQDLNSLAEAFSRIPEEHAQGIASFLRKNGLPNLSHVRKPICIKCPYTGSTSEFWT